MVGSRDDAMDLLQDVLLATFKNLASYRGEAPFGAWVFRIATFRCTDHLRKKRPIIASFDEQAGSEFSNPMFINENSGNNPDSSYEKVRTNDDIVDLLASLPNDQRQVIELKFFQHFTFDEIGGQLGISSNTAKSRLYAALRKLRSTSEEETSNVRGLQ